MYQKKCKHFYSCSSPNNKFFLQLPAFSCCFHCSIISYHCHPLTILLTHFTNNYYIWGRTFIIKQMQLHISQQLSTITPFPFDHNNTWGRVKWGEHGMGPMQYWLTTATPFKSQKSLFKARAVGSNLIHRRLSTSQLWILDPPSPVTWFTSFLSCPPTPYGLSLPSFARFCDTRISCKMDLQRHRNCFYWKEKKQQQQLNNSLQTTKLKLMSC